MTHHSDISYNTDVSHLGVLIGRPDSARIVAVSTAMVFEDKSLSKTFWGIENSAIDSGFQGHMYTRPNDILVVCIPRYDDAVVRMITTTISVNYEIWHYLTGFKLLSETGQFILASTHSGPPGAGLPANFTWHMGNLPDAAVTRWQHQQEALLAFVLDDQLTERLGLSYSDYATLLNQARNTSLLMDKNAAMQVLQEHGVDCAQTYPIQANTDLDRVLNGIPPDGYYVFKPAGGAAGVGVYSCSGRGAQLNAIRDHLNALTRNNQLPDRFQIQEFVPGIPFGATAHIKPDGNFEIFEIHQQLIDHTEGFVGARWTPALQAGQLETTRALYQQLALIRRPPFRGLIGLDIIDGKIIEINPRLTAAAPIAHLLRRQDQMVRRLGGCFMIRQIDLNTEVDIPYALILNGTLRRLVEHIWRERGVLILPQGLNPFGRSRIVFINDDPDGTTQQTFIEEMSQ